MQTRFIHFGTTTTSQEESFEQYGYLLVRRKGEDKVEVVPASHRKKAEYPRYADNEVEAVSLLKDLHPDLAIYEPQQEWRTWE